MRGILSRIQGWVKLKGATDSTNIGNTGDSLNTNVTNQVDVQFANLATDPFERLVVAQPESLFEFSHFGVTPGLWDEELTGSGTGVQDTNTPSYKISTTTASGDKVQRKSRRNIEYIRGKSSLWYLSCRPGTAKANLRKRWGGFDSSNGVFFELNGTEFKVVKRSKCTGSVIDTSKAQSAFNGDKLDGTGDSGVTIDFDMQNIFWIEFSWLGSNIIRFGILYNGKRITMHTMNYSNIINVPWSQYAIFPFAYEQENTGTVASSSDFYLSCGSVISNGGNELGFNHITSISTGTTAKSLSTTPILVAGIRTRSGKEHLSIKPLAFDFLPASGTPNCYYRILYNPTIVSGSWVNKGHIADGLSSYSSYSGGSVIKEGYFDLGSSGGGGGGGGGGSIKGTSLTSVLMLNSTHIGSSINGSSDVIAMEVRTISSSGSVHFTGSIKEFV